MRKFSLLTTLATIRPEESFPDSRGLGEELGLAGGTAGGAVVVVDDADPGGAEAADHDIQDPLAGVRHVVGREIRQQPEKSHGHDVA